MAKKKTKKRKKKKKANTALATAKAPPKKYDGFEEAVQAEGQYESDIQGIKYEQNVYEQIGADGVMETVVDYTIRPTTAFGRGAGEKYDKIDWKN